MSDPQPHAVLIPAKEPNAASLRLTDGRLFLYVASSCFPLLSTTLSGLPSRVCNCTPN